MKKKERSEKKDEVEGDDDDDKEYDDDLLLLELFSFSGWAIQPRRLWEADDNGDKMLL